MQDMSSIVPHKQVVMAGLDPAIHDLPRGRKDVDARHKAGHDDAEGIVL
jgi:hypothetical protein